MVSGFKVVVALLVITAVATVLISPDPSDDVAGILHQHLKLQKLTPIVIEPLDALAGASLGVMLAALRASASSPLDVVALTCVRLC
jgi:Na+/proline symporter